jgi:hypothetical protein
LAQGKKTQWEKNKAGILKQFLIKAILKNSLHRCFIAVSFRVLCKIVVVFFFHFNFWLGFSFAFSLVHIYKQALRDCKKQSLNKASIPGQSVQTFKF